MDMVAQFLREVRAELARIEWPKPDAFIGSTIVVLVLVALFALFLGGVDRVIAWFVWKIVSMVM